MTVTFLGTRGGIIARSPRHYNHSITLVSYYSHTLLLDCGADWLDTINTINADAALITHAHPDHIGGLARGAPFPVYATKHVWQEIDHYPIEKRNIISPYQQLRIAKLFTVEVFPVVHSLHAPAVGYRITAGKRTIFYISDLIKIKQERKALKGIDLYIGDGARITRPLIRKTDAHPFGHTSIKQQLQWCQRYGIQRAIFTHCGSEIVKHKKSEIQPKIDALAQEYDVEVMIAYDGMKYVV